MLAVLALVKRNKYFWSEEKLSYNSVRTGRILLGFLQFDKPELQSFWKYLKGLLDFGCNFNKIFYVKFYFEIS